MGRDNDAAAAEICSGSWHSESAAREQYSGRGSSCVKVLLLLVRLALKLAATTKYIAAAWCDFLASSAVTECMLQLLASRCSLMHKQHVQQQQGLALSRQLGKRMRGDLLLLADPRDQLLQLLPSNEFLAGDASVTAAGDSSFDIHDVIFGMSSIRESISSSSSSSVGCSNHPALSAAALQLSLQLLRLAASFWQHHHHSLSEQQQLLLSIAAPNVSNVSRDELAELLSLNLQAQQLFMACMQLLRLQLRTLRANGQWQPQLQLLQLGGGEVLLQGLTLHCSGMHCQMRARDVFSVQGMVTAVYRCVPGVYGCSFFVYLHMLQVVHACNGQRGPFGTGRAASVSWPRPSPCASLLLTYRRHYTALYTSNRASLQ
jgi:hypothetical protein